MLCQAIRMEGAVRDTCSSVHPITTTTTHTAAKHSGMDDLTVMKDTPVPSFSLPTEWRMRSSCEAST